MSQWDGKTERRKEGYYCDGHPETREAIILLKNNMQHLADAVTRIDKHMEEAAKSRTGWWMAVFSVIFGLIFQTFVFSYYIGSATKQIEINTKRLDVLERHYTEWVLIREKKPSGQ
jgi:hypothetical protein